MRKIAFFVLLAVAAAVFVPVAADAARRPSDREKKELTRKEKADMCCGSMRIVSSDADFKVAIRNDSGADKTVRIVTRNAYSSSTWSFCESSYNYTIQFVTSAEDFSVRFVN